MRVPLRPPFFVFGKKLREVEGGRGGWERKKFQGVQFRVKTEWSTYRKVVSLSGKTVYHGQRVKNAGTKKRTKRTKKLPYFGGGGGVPSPKSGDLVFECSGKRGFTRDSEGGDAGGIK